LQKELSTEEIRALLDELAVRGSLWLLMTGGEPLIRNDFEELYVYAKRRGFLITLFTNGTLVDKRTIKLLSEYPPFVVEVTLYGATEETYEKVTRVKGSYGRCLRGVTELVTAGIKLKMKTMALTINQHEMDAMDKMAQELGCEFRFDPIVQKRMDNNRHSEPENYRISPEDVVRLDRMFPRRMTEYKTFCSKFIARPPKNRRLYQCGAGDSSIHVNPYGLAMGCFMMVRDGFSLRERSLQWIWEKGISSVRNKKKDFVLPCDECRLINLCGQCPPWSILENGEVKKEVAYLCRIAKIRAKDFEFIRDADK
jgi:radical SAM protein with 4Fe4S-binding SPASM domain